MEKGSYIQVHFGDNLDVLKKIPDESVDLIYIDPPFNTGVKQIRKRFHTEGGCKVFENTYGYQDSFDDFLGFLRPRMEEAYRILKAHGSLFFHLDYREIHYCKVMLDTIFGRDSFINEIIWAYDYGARSKKKWSAKHDNILWYAKNPDNYIFNYEDMDRIPYMAPGLVGAEKAARGKTPTDVWWHTIVSPNSREKTGYATQKPLGIIRRIVKIHSRKGDVLMDFFAGSGTLGEAAIQLERSCILVDCNPEAISVMKRRFQTYNAEWINCDEIEAAGEYEPSEDTGNLESFEGPEGFMQPMAPLPSPSVETKELEEKTRKRRGRPPKYLKKDICKIDIHTSPVSAGSNSYLSEKDKDSNEDDKKILEIKKTDRKMEYIFSNTQQGTLL